MNSSIIEQLKTAGSFVTTSECAEQNAELDRLIEADAFAAPFVVGGALMDESTEDPTRVKLAAAIDQLSGETDFTDEASDVMFERERWAYRVGLVVGLRLGRALEGSAVASKGGAR